MGNELCFKCRQKLAEWYAKNCQDLSVYLWVKGLLHCHHEPREKLKCWCESGYAISPPFYYVEDKIVHIPLRFCPECGNKLKCTT